MFRTIVLISFLTLFAGQAATDLRSDADTVADFDSLDVGPDASSVANNLVPDYQRKLALAPALLKSVHIRATHTTMCDSDLNIVSLKVLRLEIRDLQLFEVLGILT